MVNIYAGKLNYDELDNIGISKVYKNNFQISYNKSTNMFQSLIIDITAGEFWSNNIFWAWLLDLVRLFIWYDLSYQHLYQIAFYF